MGRVIELRKTPNQEGIGRGHNKGTITVTIRALKRQKEPSVTPIFYKLRQNTALSRQRSRVRAPSSPPSKQTTYNVLKASDKSTKRAQKS